MARALQRPRKTVEDLRALGEEVCAELIHGEIYVNPSPGADHQGAVLELAAAFLAHGKATQAGRVFVAPLDVHLPTGDVVQPDLVFVAAGHESIIQRVVHGVPDLLVEVVSPDRPERDRIVKRDLYARCGVPEYWIVEPEPRAVEMLRLEGTTYRPAGYALRGDALRTPQLPGFELPVADLFP